MPLAFGGGAYGGGARRAGQARTGHQRAPARDAAVERARAPGPRGDCAGRAGSRGDLSQPVPVEAHGASPLTRRWMMGPSRNLSRAPSASSGSAAPPLDRTTSRPWFRAYRVRGEEWSVGLVASVEGAESGRIGS
jgi:hypothetical protein